jgi:sodium pump decarboxylase gamma subunit
MIRDATIVMVLGMGTVFLVLLALLGMMTLGGRVAQRFAGHEEHGAGDAAAGAKGHGGGARSDGAGGHQDDIAVAIVAARRHRARRDKGILA